MIISVVGMPMNVHVLLEAATLSFELLKRNYKPRQEAAAKKKKDLPPTTRHELTLGEEKTGLRKLIL